jgi:Pectinacetylesterase
MLNRAFVPLCLALLAAVPSANGATPAQKCEATAASALATCFGKVGERVRRCYSDTGAPCPDPDATITKAIAKLAGSVLKKCGDTAVVQAAGFGAVTTGADLLARLADSCRGEPASLAARTFGGPQGVVLANPDARACVLAAMKESLKQMRSQLRVYAGCVRKIHKGGTCDNVKTLAKIAHLQAKAVAHVSAVCADLTATLGMTVDDYATRGAKQAECMASTGTGADALGLACAPIGPVPALGTWTQVTLDEATWGTRCGDGSPYAFWVQLATNPALLEHVVIDLEGGGVCLLEADCASVPQSLFQATDNGRPNGGYMSDDAIANPFAGWTRIFLPYCTQDVHIGGGGQSVFTSQTVNRFGAVNVRATLRYLRGLLVSQLEATSPAGYRPDRLTVFFAGESAGAFGVQYNYHYLLDDLRWTHTTAVPDAGLALNSDAGANVQLFGNLIVNSAPPSSFAWLVKPYLPTYCLEGTCAVGPVLQVATSPRLKAVPEQQILNVSNQVDSTQVSTTFFPDVVSWINAVRTSYCDNQGLNGIRSWLAARTASYHTILRDTTLFTTQTAGGITVRDWLVGAFADPDAVADKVDEGTLVTDYPGVSPIACLPGSPSGAFID